VRIEWHEAAVEDLRLLDPAVRQRTRHVLQEELPKHLDLRRKLEPYRGPLKGYWKLRGLALGLRARRDSRRIDAVRRACHTSERRLRAAGHTVRPGPALI
jgi:hypothetical protein